MLSIEDWVDAEYIHVYMYQVLISTLLLIADLDNFPYMTAAGTESPTDRPRSSTRKSTEYNHETEIIFALPSLEMVLKTEHLQGETEPLEDGKLQ